MENPTTGNERKLEKLEKSMLHFADSMEIMVTDIENTPDSVSSDQSGSQGQRRQEAIIESISRTGNFLERIGGEISSTFSSLSPQQRGQERIQRSQISIMESLQSMLRSLYRAVGSVIGTAAELAKKLLDSLTKAISGIMKWIGIIFEDLCEAVKVAVKAIWKGFAWFLEKTFNITVAVLKKIANLVWNGTMYVVDVGTQIVTTVGSAVVSAGARTYRLASDIVSSGLVQNNPGAAVAAGLVVAGALGTLLFFLS